MNGIYIYKIGPNESLSPGTVTEYLVFFLITTGMILQISTGTRSVDHMRALYYSGPVDCSFSRDYRIEFLFQN